MKKLYRIHEEKLNMRLKKLFKAQRAMIETGQSVKSPCDFAKLTGEINGLLWIVENRLTLKK